MLHLLESRFWARVLLGLLLRVVLVVGYMGAVFYVAAHVTIGWH